MTKQLLLFTILIFSIGLLQAQPVLNAESVPQIGESWVGFFQEMDTLDYPAGDAGANQSWDFSGLADSLDIPPAQLVEELKANPFLTFSAVDPQTVLYADSFPEADLAIRIFLDFIALGDIYSFGKIENDGVYELGELDITSVEFLGQTFVDTTLSVYPEPRLFIPLPLNFGDSFIRYDSTVVEDPDFGTTTTTISRDSIVVDAYGDLTTAFETYPSTQRWAVYSSNRTITTSSEDGSVFSDETDQSLSYQWYAPDQLAPLVTYNFPGGEEELGLISYYLVSNEVSSARDQERIAFPLRISPNPVQDQLNLEFTLDQRAQDMRAIVFDLNGRLVQAYSLGDRPAGTYREQLQLPADLPAGKYALRLSSGQLISTQLIVVTK